MTDAPPHLADQLPDDSESNNAESTSGTQTSHPTAHSNCETEKPEASATADNPLERIRKVIGQNIAHKVALSQLAQQFDYYDLALKGKRKGFWAAFAISILGFSFFVVSFSLLYRQWNKATNDKDKIVQFVLDTAKGNNSEPNTASANNSNPSNTASSPNSNNATVNPNSSGNNNKPQPNKATIINTLFANANAAVANTNAAVANAATAGVICGALLEFVALGIFYFYGRGFAGLQDHLDINQRFLLANSICEVMEGEYRQKAQTKLVESLLEHDLKNQEQQDSKKIAETGAANNNSSASQSPKN